MRTVGDLLAHYPRRYAQRGELTPISSLPVGEPVTIVAEVQRANERRMQNRKGSLLEVVISDGQGELSLTFFNQSWRLKDLRPGRRGIFAGKVGEYRGAKQLAHPDYELFDDEETARLTAEANANLPIPIYPATSTIASWQLHEDRRARARRPRAGRRSASRRAARAARSARRAHRDRAHPPPRLRGPDRAGAQHAAHARGVRAAGRAAAAAAVRARAVGDAARRRARCSSGFDESLPFPRTPDQVVGGRPDRRATCRATGR